MTRVVGLRKQLKPQFEKTYGVGLSFLPFIMRAVVDGIARWPWMNAEVRGDEAAHQALRQHGHGRRHRRRQGPAGAGHQATPSS